MAKAINNDAYACAFDNGAIRACWLRTGPRGSAKPGIELVYIGISTTESVLILLTRSYINTFQTPRSTSRLLAIYGSSVGNPGTRKLPH
jgi:hypothetical protein